MSVNLTNITNIDGGYALAKYANDATSGSFWGIILIAIFFIIVMNLRKAGIGAASASASFGCLMISIILFRLGLIHILYPVFFVLILAGSVFYLKFSSDRI